jgi:2'-5' RNA ligase
MIPGDGATMGGMPPVAAESAVVVPVPEAEPAVAACRARLDHNADLGVPAHVTLLAPFAPPAAITPAMTATLAEVIGSVPAFDCVFERTAWFGETVLWLAPEPDGPFRELTRRLAAAFPDYPPFGGVYADVVPHLTAGLTGPGGSGALRTAEAEVARGLPVSARISRAWLMTGSRAPGSWHTVAELPLAPAGPSTDRRG